MKKFILTMAAIFAVGSTLALFPACAPQGPQEAVIFHTNDTHGYLQGDGEKCIGIDQLAALHKSTENSLLIDAGDATQGLPLASLTKGQDVIDLMNVAGYDAMAAGNHEFDFGSDVFKQNAARAKFPVLAANVYEGDRPILQTDKEDGCSTILNAGEYKIGFFGIVTKDTATSVNPALLGNDVSFRDEVQTAKAQIDVLYELGVDAIIAICHLGDATGGASCTSDDFANAMTAGYNQKLTAIIDGHSHTTENKQTNGIPIVQTGCQMQHVGKLTLDFSGEKVRVKDDLLSPQDFAQITPDKETHDKLTAILAEQETYLNTKLCPLTAPLWGGNVGKISIARAVETNFGDFAADAMIMQAEAYMKEKGLTMPLIGIENAGGIRGGALGTSMTMRDLVTAFPNSNTLYLKKITPEILYQMMELSAKELDGIDQDGILLQTSNSGGFLQIGGFTVVYDAAQPKGTPHVLSITLDGESQPLDRTDTTTEIMLVGNNYILSGGSGYTMLKDLPRVVELGGELEAVRSYCDVIEKTPALAQKYIRPQNRIIMEDSTHTFSPKEYTAIVLVTGAQAGETLPVTLDGVLTQAEVVQDPTHGLCLRLPLADGAHTLRYGTQNVYLDNYLGIGLMEDAFRTFPHLTK